MRELIFKKIEELQTKKPTLNRFFVFSIEEVTNDYEGCLESIEIYLESHKDKIKDFEFDSWIDSEDFSLVLMLKMKLDESLSKHIMPSNILNCLLPSSTESRILRERIQNIFLNYSWDFNKEENRKNMIKELEIALSLQDIEDKTTPENIDMGFLNFIIKAENKEITINEYLESIEKIKIFE